MCAPDAEQPDGGEGGGGGFGNLPSSGPLPPHLVVKKEQGIIYTLHGLHLWGGWGVHLLVHSCAVYRDYTWTPRELLIGQLGLLVFLSRVESEDDMKQ